MAADTARIGLWHDSCFTSTLYEPWESACAMGKGTAISTPRLRPGVLTSGDMRVKGNVMT
jgi:hypothetical protein